VSDSVPESESDSVPESESDSVSDSDSEPDSDSDSGSGSGSDLAARLVAVAGIVLLNLARTLVRPLGLAIRRGGRARGGSAIVAWIELGARPTLRVSGWADPCVVLRIARRRDSPAAWVDAHFVARACRVTARPGSVGVRRRIGRRVGSSVGVDGHDRPSAPRHCHERHQQSHRPHAGRLEQPRGQRGSRLSRPLACADLRRPRPDAIPTSASEPEPESESESGTESESESAKTAVRRPARRRSSSRTASSSAGPASPP
jgi:hypothetical protein